MKASNRLLVRGIALGLLSLYVLAGSPARAGLIHDYEFKGTLADSQGGPALTSLGGTVGASSYVFGAEQGLALSGGLTAAQSSTYTIDLNFEFDTITGYKKILDFKNLTADNGLYNLSTALTYYLGGPVMAPSGAFAPGTFVRIDLTRDNATNLFVAYVNGVSMFSFTDTSGDAVFSTATSHIMNFFQDDSVTGGTESSAGSVNQIRIYDSALTASQVAALGQAPSVPEPSAVIMVVSGLAIAGFGTRRFRRRDV